MLEPDKVGAGTYGHPVFQVAPGVPRATVACHVMGEIPVSHLALNRHARPHCTGKKNIHKTATNCNSFADEEIPMRI